MMLRMTSFTLQYVCHNQPTTQMQTADSVDSVAVSSSNTNGHFALQFCDKYFRYWQHHCQLIVTDSGKSSFTDHFCISKSLAKCVTRSFIADSGENMSDYLPLFLT